MDAIEKELSEKLNKEGKLEGGLFIYIYIRYNGEDYTVRKYYYTVKNGIVFSINPDGSLGESKDSLYVIKTHCKNIGKYNPSKKYLFKTVFLSYKQIAQLFEIN